MSEESWHMALAFGCSPVQHAGKGRQIWQVTSEDLSADVTSLDWKNADILECSLLIFVQFSTSKKNSPCWPCCFLSVCLAVWGFLCILNIFHFGWQWKNPLRTPPFFTSHFLSKPARPQGSGSHQGGFVVVAAGMGRGQWWQRAGAVPCCRVGVQRCLQACRSHVVGNWEGNT